VLFVFPEEAGLMPSAEVVFEKPSRGSLPLRVELGQPIEVPVLLVGREDGRPIKGSRVELVQPQRRLRGSPRAVEVGIRCPALSTRRMHIDGEGPGIAWLLGSGTTDSRGRVILRVARTSEPSVLRAIGPGHVPEVCHRIHINKLPAEIRVEVSRGAVVRGQIVPQEFLESLMPPAARRLPQLRLIERRPGKRRLPVMSAWQVQRDGSFELRDIPAGLWDLFLTAWKPGSRGRVVQEEIPVPIAHFRLSSGKVTTVRIDGRDLACGSIRGLVRCNGKALASARLYTQLGSPASGGSVKGRVWQSNIATDANGRFVATGLYPGHYRLGVASSTLSALHVSSWLQLTAGGSIDRVFDFKAAPVDLQIVNAHGRPLQRRTQVLVEFENSVGSFSGQLDAGGRVRISLVPPGKHAVIVFLTKGSNAPGRKVTRVNLQPIRVTSSIEEQRFTRKTPAGW